MTTGMISIEEWNRIQDKLLKARQRKIKIKQVMKGNKEHLNKQVQKLVNDMYRDGYIGANTKRLQNNLNIIQHRAKRIVNY